VVFKLIGFFTGFFLSGVLDTTLGEFQEWAIVGAALITASLELISKFFYLTIYTLYSFFDGKYSILKLVYSLNYLKLGILYGLIVDAFKLGS
jgi:hypothetical protein